MKFTELFNSSFLFQSKIKDLSRQYFRLYNEDESTLMYSLQLT